MEMNKKQLLKYLAILTLLTSIIGAITSFALIVSISNAVVNQVDFETNLEFQNVAATILLLTSFAIFVSFIDVFKSIFALKAVNQNRFGIHAYVFSIISLVLNILNSILKLTTSSFYLSNIFSSIIMVVMCAIILYLSNSIRKEYKEEKENNDLLINS